MQRRILTAAALLVGAACASTPKNELTETRERIANRSAFDVASCYAGEDVKTPNTTTPNSVMGALMAARPLVLSCLVDPANRKEAEETAVNISTTVDSTGAKHTVTGENLTEAGTSCINGMLERGVKLNPVAEGAEAVTAEFPVVHNVTVGPAVVLGLNEPSDIVGAIRLAQQGWCDCFAADHNATPSSFKATIDVAAGSSTVSTESLVKVGEEPAAAEGADKAEAAAPAMTSDPIGACLNQKLATVQVAAPSKPWKLPYLFEFTNSRSDTPAENASPSTQFEQLEARRAMAQANTAMVVGDGDVARASYAALVDRYQKNRRSVQVPQLVEGCKALVAADDAYIGAVESQRDTEKRVLDFATAQAAQDPRWADVVTAATEVISATEAEIVRAKEQRAQDEGICPKVRL